MRIIAPMLAGVALLTAGTISAAEFVHEAFDDGQAAILILGDIEVGDENAFRELTIRYPDAIVALDSDGGALIPALEIGRLIRLRNYMTMVLDDGVCVSSCALIWLAGTRRGLSTSAQLGFHASYVNEGGVMVESGVANALVGRYLSQLNLSEDAVVFATFAPPQEVAWLNRENKSAAGIDFEWFEAEEPSPAEPPPINVTVTPPAVQVVRNADATPRSAEAAGALGESTSELAARLKAEMSKPGFAEAAARSIGAESTLQRPMAEHFKLLYANDAVIERLAYELEAARIDIRTNPQAAGSLILRLATGLIYKGAQRLPQHDVNRLLYFLAEVTQRQDSSCADLEDRGEVNINEFKLVDEIGEGALEEYLSILRRSIFAEVERFPDRIILDAQQKEIAENAWGDILLEEIEQRSDYDQLFHALLDMDSADKRTQCQLQKIMFPAVAEMKGLSGDWFRRIFLTYVEESM